MKDVDYVKRLLASDYATEKPHEIPHPLLEAVIGATNFDYLAGTVEGEVPNGSESREGHPYLWFQRFGKSLLSHRFIAAVTLGSWVPRECDIDHINHNPSDNRPVNLRVTTKRDNAGNRRKALLSELVDVAQVGVTQKILSERRLADIAAKTPLKPKPTPVQRRATKPSPKVVPQPLAPVVRVEEDPKFAWLRAPTGEPELANQFTGETKPGVSGGIWRKTTRGSWHFDPEAPRGDYDDIPW